MTKRNAILHIKIIIDFDQDWHWIGFDQDLFQFDI